ncbi:MAG TPA: J domain-containing protein [Kofleriaceae bacterium]|nr:J domain-containing protein [Kofleriaceae bacterium]
MSEGQDEARARARLVDMMGRLTRGPHEALGIAVHATAADIRAAFLGLTKQFHPARFGRMSSETQRLANEVFLGLRAAHDALAKPKPRTSPAILPSNTPVTTPRGPQPGAPSRPSPHPLASQASPSNAVPGRFGGQVATAPSPTVLRPPASAGGSGSLPAARPTPDPRTPPTRPSDRPLRTPSSSPPPQPGSERRVTPAYGVRVPSTSASQSGSQPAMRSSATMPAQPAPPSTPATPPAPPAGPRPTGTMPNIDRELVPVYDLMQRGQWEQARQVITALSSKSRGAPKYRALLSYTRGRQAQLAGARDDARIELETALQLDPDLQLAKTALAELFARRK